MKCTGVGLVLVSMCCAVGLMITGCNGDSSGGDGAGDGGGNGSGGAIGDDVTGQEMAGTWTGTASYRGPSDTGQADVDEDVIRGPMTVALTSPNGVGVTGSWSFMGKSGPISGNPVNGVVSFSLPNTDPGNPDCASFNVRATITMRGGQLVFAASGNFCNDYCPDGDGGVELCGGSGTIDATLTR